MKNSPTQTAQPQPGAREVFILRIRHNGSQRTLLVEIQSVQTGEVTHLSSLEAIPAYITSRIKAGQAFTQKPGPG